MDQNLVERLKKSQKETEVLKAQVTSDLRKERDRLAKLKAEIELRSRARDALIIELFNLGFRSSEIAQHAGVVPSYITYVRKRDS